MTYRRIFIRCMVILFVIVAIAAVVALWVPLARAQEVCMPFDKAVAALEKQYQEQMIGAGISANNDYIYQLFMHRTGRTWTLLRTDRKGETCFIAAGKDWSEIDAWAVQPQSIDHRVGTKAMNLYNQRADSSGSTPPSALTSPTCVEVKMANAEDRAAVEWRSIPSFPDYEISEYGEIRRPGGKRVGCGRGKRLSPADVSNVRALYAAGHTQRAIAKRYGIGQASVSRWLKRKADNEYYLKGIRLDKHGYLRTAFLRDGRRTHPRIHQLVAEAFIGPKPFPDAQVAHWDGNKHNNHYTNLRWTDAAGNNEDKERHGTMARGSTHPRAKITESDVREIRARYANSEISMAELARIYGFKSYTNISNIVHRLSWRHVL